MTLRANKFTPKTLVSAPRRSSATTSADGTLFLVSHSSYSFETHSQSHGIVVVDLEDVQATLLTGDATASEPQWLGLGHEVVWLKKGENGNTSLVVADAKDAGKTYKAGTLSGPVSNLKIHLLDARRAVVAFSAQSNPDGSLYNPHDVAKPRSSGRVYDSLFVRHWDSYVGPQRNTVWTAMLQKLPSNVTAREGRWSLLGVTNMLKQFTSLECPVPPFGGAEHFDIGDSFVALVSKVPHTNPATHTACLIYVMAIPRILSMEDGPADPMVVQAEGKSTPMTGAASSPVFSPDQTSMAYLLMSEDGYESDQNQIHLLRLRQASVLTSQALDIRDSDAKWDRSPSRIMFSADSSKLLVIAEDTGCVCLFELDLAAWLSSGSTRVAPRKLTSSGSISNVSRASFLSEKLLISGSSLTESSIYYFFDPADPQRGRTAVSSLANDGAISGLSRSQASELWWKGANDQPIHAWMVKPSSFRSGKKYPLAYMIHGGPQGAWTDEWSTRWNLALFAEQGYVVVAPNPTGSTGYGQAFTDAIREEWGGLPYDDLVRGFEYIEAELSDFVDASRAVALGASYGGYMINWIQGHNLGRKFKALVCHDGVFSMRGQLASDEQYFPIHDLGGPIWNQQYGYDKWDPSRFTENWCTPQLVIHNELDYRLTIAEGLAAFNVLQMRDVDSRFLTFPDEGHWVLGHENSLLWHTVVINWMNKYAGLPPLEDKESTAEPAGYRKDAAHMPVDEQMRRLGL